MRKVGSVTVNEMCLQAISNNARSSLRCAYPMTSALVDKVGQRMGWAGLIFHKLPSCVDGHAHPTFRKEGHK